jgi:uncharacterized metal-binding protein YceD (DUF177 family)
VGKLDKFKLPLKSLSLGTHVFEFQLDTPWFELMDGPDVQKGKLNAIVRVINTGNLYDLRFELSGGVQVPCDRCLDDMTIEVDQKSQLFVKFGPEFFEESEDMIVVPEREGELNVAWFLYELIVFSIPLKHVHAPGKCNKAMMIKLKKHMAGPKDEEEAEVDFTDEEDFEAADDNDPVSGSAWED